MTDEIMTNVDGIRVRRDEEKQYRSLHKAVLAPEPQKAADKKPVGKNKPTSSDNE